MSTDPRADLRFGDLFAFDGAEDLWQSWRDGLTPDPLLDVSEWADRHRILSPRASAEPGRYRTDRTPYMRAIVDALSPSHPVRRVIFMKAAQVGATEAGNNWIGYVHHAPGPMLAVQPTVELAERFSRQRIDQLIAESPSLRERVKPARSRDAGNTGEASPGEFAPLPLEGRTDPLAAAKDRARPRTAIRTAAGRSATAPDSAIRRSRRAPPPRSGSARRFRPIM